MLTRFILGGGAGLLAAFLFVLLRVRDGRHKRRELSLETAVRQRTEELEAERIRDRAWNQILEMLVMNESLGVVLDGIARLVKDEIRGAHCVILLKQVDGWHTGAAPAFTPEWLAAINTPHSVPFEVWRQPCRFQPIATDPAWRVFSQRLTADLPAMVHSAPVGSVDMTLGAILLFESDQFPAENRHAVLESASRLAQVAIEHRRLYDDLQFQAHHDNLTGLPNRTLFEDRLDRSCVEARNLDRQLAVLFVDLDRFKQINETMSHRIGDLLLAEVSGRLRRAVRPGDTVARVGGDEFNVLIPNIKVSAEAEEIGARILASIRQPLVIEGRAIEVSASVGIALYPGDGVETDSLQRAADAAVNCAKASGRDRVQLFSTRNEKLDRVRMDQELRLALREGWFAVHYQPKIGVDGHLCGLEALLRLDHPVHGRISPAEFIPIAEESGLIVQMGAWVLDEVCRQIAEWKEQGTGEVCVAVNVSSLQLSRPDFAKQVLDCLGKHGVSPWSIELELTESLLMSGGEASQRQMQELRTMGIRFSIDDFGTGYSSLSYLHRLQVDAIKLDRSFVQCVDTDPAARRLVQAMIGVAEGLGLGVIAEGVETESQRTALIAAGCLMMQGFLFSRPQPASELIRYLRGGTSNLDDLLRIGRAAEPAARLAGETLPV